MKKILILSLVLLLLISGVSGYTISKEMKSEVILAEVGNPVVFDLTINGGAGDDFAEVYSLLGLRFDPQATFNLPGSITKEVKAYAGKDYLNHPGNYIVDYYVRGSLGQVMDSLSFRVVSLKDAIAIIPSNLGYDDTIIELSVQNTQNAYMNDVVLTFDSEFGVSQQKLSLEPFGKANVSIPVDASKSKKLSAGRYIITASIAMEDAKVKVEGVVNYLEKEGTSIVTEKDGFIIRTTKITKKNEGNVPVQDKIEISKDVLSRLFTTFSDSSDKSERSGLGVNYIWTKPLQPGESWVVSSTTNYTLPFFLLLLIVVVAVLVNLYSKTNVVVSKQVSYVKTRGGEFALKVRIGVKARSHVDRIQVIDRLPGMTKLYEKFGIKPDKIDPMTRRIFWNVSRLQAGEERVFSYIIYSTVNVVGRFELPATTAIYEKDGKTHEVLSNRAFFMSEMSSQEE
ncbi:MAG: hypothetical protein AABX11_02545 [Nanoarchaeota archaeon]